MCAILFLYRTVLGREVGELEGLVRASGGKPYRLGVEPDRVFGLRFKGAPENRRSAYFFLEADRGTMPVARKGLAQTSFLRKLLAYQETWRRGLHRAHLGIPNFRVLTVTTSRERVEHLIEACRSVAGGGSRLFLFADRETLGRDILTCEWVNGRGERSLTLKPCYQNHSHMAKLH